MEYTHLGRSGLSVSRFVLGTMNFGPETSEEDSHTIMDRAHEHGINLCADIGEDPACVGLAWLLAQDGVTGPIIGPRTVEQLDGSLRALAITLGGGTLAKLDELFPPPALNGAKPAPEAYAW